MGPERQVSFPLTASIPILCSERTGSTMYNIRQSKSEEPLWELGNRSLFMETAHFVSRLMGDLCAVLGKGFFYGFIPTRIRSFILETLIGPLHGARHRSRLEETVACRSSFCIEEVTSTQLRKRMVVLD